MKLDFLALRFDTFDRISFTKEVLSFSKNSLIIFYNFEEFTLGHKPEGINNFPTKIKFPFMKNKSIVKLFFPFIAGFHIFVYVGIFFYLCLRYRPKVVYTANTWAGISFVIAKKLKICKKFIFFGGDWLITEQKKSLPTRILLILWVYADKMCSQSCDLLINLTEEIKNCRTSYWGKQIAKLECVDFPPNLQIHPKAKITNNRLNICYLGQVRKEASFDSLLPSLPSLNKKYGIRLKVVGPKSPLHDELIALAKRSGVDKYVDFYYWIESESLHEVLGECFCGINFLGSSDHYGNNTIPGKLMHYVQHLVPPLITNNNGPYSEIINQNKLGLVTILNRDEVKKSIEILFNNQLTFQKSIAAFLENQNKKTTITDYINMIRKK